MPNDVTIHSWRGSALQAEVTRKVSLYGAEVICTIWTGEIGRPNSNVDARELANALCEYLERKRAGDGDEA